MSVSLPPKWCGVEHSHAMHQWVEPSGMTGFYRYCPGSTHSDDHTSMVEAPCGRYYVHEPHGPHDWTYRHTLHGDEWRHCPGGDEDPVSGQWYAARPSVTPPGES